MVLSLLLMVLDHRYTYVEGLRSTLSAVVYPIRFLVTLPIEGGRWLSETLATRSRLLAENRALRQENLMLRSRFQKFASLNQENRRLRALLDSAERLGERVLLADLMAADLEPGRQQIVLDKGSRDGVYSGQPLVDDNGVMGQIRHVGPFSSTALLLTDPAHAIPVQVNRTGLRAIAAGTGEGLLKIDYVPVSADIRVGDQLISSGLGGRFPAGYPVAVVTAVTRDTGDAYARIVARPNARLHLAQHVLLVWPEVRPEHVDALTLREKAR